MTISIITLFPQMFDGPLDWSIIKRAKEKNLLTVNLIHLRDFATDSYKTVDDHPYGGGTGMVLKVDVMDRAIEKVKEANPGNPPHIILLTPQGTPYHQSIAKRLSKHTHILLICGHYEGFDERIRSLVDEEISIGDFVLTGGEIPALVLTDSIVRLIPSVLKKADATENESFSQDSGLLEYPQYTKPTVYKNQAVPDVLLSGDPKKISAWQKDESLKKTKKKRKDLL